MNSIRCRVDTADTPVPAFNCVVELPNSHLSTVLHTMMQHMRSATLSALLLLLTMSSCSAGSPTGSFSEWLAAKKTGAAKVQNDGYEQYAGARENVHQCLKEVHNKNCRVMGDPEHPAAAYFESGVTCCDARSHSGNSMGNANIEVSNCKYIEHYFPEDMPISEAPGVEKIGEFTVQCYLNAASDSCGHPFCDQMVLEAAGGIYHAEDIVLASRPITPTIEASCPPLSDGSGASRRVIKTNPLKGKGRKARRFAGKAVGNTGKESGEKTGDATLSNAEYKSKEPSLYSGEAVIYFGPMTVNSRVHDVSIHQGWFEYVYDYKDGDAITESDAEGKHMIDPYTYSLKFYKPAHGSY